MYTSDEYRSKEYPEYGGKPPPDDRYSRPQNRPKPRDRREMVSEQDDWTSRHEVDPVLELTRWRLSGRIESKYLSPEKTGIETIGQDIGA